MSAARIGRVRMKDGGADIRILRNERLDGDGTENWRGDIVRCARLAEGYSRPGSELCGFVVVGLFSDGASSIGWRHDTRRCPIPRALLPALVSEHIRRDMVTHPEAVDTFNRLEGKS